MASHSRPARVGSLANGCTSRLVSLDDEGAVPQVRPAIVEDTLAIVLGIQELSSTRAGS